MEGIAEALVIPTLVKKRMFPQDTEEHRRGRARLRGTAIVDIAGIDFTPYVELVLKATQGGARIADRVLVVTDEDDGAGEKRATKMAGLVGSPTCLRVSVTPNTFEAALFDADSKNAALLLLTAREVLGHEVTATTGAAFVGEIKKSRIRKGELAQALAARIEDGAPFVVPPDLHEKLTWLLGGDLETAM